MATKKSPEQFSVVRYNGEKKFIDLGKQQWNSMSYEGGSDYSTRLWACRYTPYIPLFYATMYPNNWCPFYDNDIETYSSAMSHIHAFKKDIGKKKIADKLLNMNLGLRAAMRDGWAGRGDNGAKEGFYKAINDYFSADVVKSILQNNVCVVVNSTAKAVDCFFGLGFYGDIRFTAKTYLSNVGILSWNILNNRDVSPHILGCVPIQNYNEVRLRYLMERKIDLSKCVVFVDREMETTNFHLPSFRLGVYRKHILPKLKEMDCTVAHVPLSFIEENCFLQSYKFRSEGIIERKKEEEFLIREMYKNMTEGEESRGERVSMDMDAVPRIDP